MTYKEYLLSGITCCFGPCYTSTLSGFDIFMFSLGSLVIISILLFYYSKISKSNNTKTELDNPIYQTKDILLQSNCNDDTLIITQSTTSTWVKVLVFILIAFVIIIPIDQLFGVVNSFY